MTKREAQSLDRRYATRITHAHTTDDGVYNNSRMWEIVYQALEELGMDNTVLELKRRKRFYA